MAVMLGGLGGGRLPMRRALFALFAAAALGGCVSMLEQAYDERARDECDQNARAGDRGLCYDRVEQHRRDRDRE
jgi:hypothetical protein